MIYLTVVFAELYHRLEYCVNRFRTPPNCSSVRLMMSGRMLSIKPCRLQAADELAPDYERVISRAQMGDKLYAAESKLSKANALFADVHDVHFVKPAYNIESPDEDEQRDAAALLSKYPHWRLLLEMVHDTTLEAEAIIKELRKGI